MFRTEGCGGNDVHLTALTVDETTHMTLDELISYGYEDDTAKSVIVPRGWMLMAYTDDAFKGDYEIVYGKGTCADLTTTKNGLTSLRLVNKQRRTVISDGSTK